MGRLHARLLAARDDVELVAAVDPLRPAAAGSLPWADRVPADLDFAVVATPTVVHAEVAGPLLAAGVPVLVEKPLAHTPGAAERLAAAPRLAVNHLERFNPALDALPAGARLRFVRAERLGPFQRRGVDVDVVHDLMVHDLDLLLHLAGGAVEALRAVGVGVVTSGIDIAEAWVELSTGCVASLTASRVSARRVRTWRVVTDDAYWSLDLAAHRAHAVPWGAGELRPRPVDLPERNALVAMHDAFLAAVRSGGPMPVTGEEGWAAVVLAHRVSEAVRRHAACLGS